MAEDGFEARYKDLEHEVKRAERAGAEKTGKRKQKAAAAKAAAATAAPATDAQKEAAATDEAKEAKKDTEEAVAAATSGKKEAKHKDEEILALIHERRTIEKYEKEGIREVSKKIKTCIREKKRTARQEKKIKRSWKNISNVKSARKRILIPKNKNVIGEAITTRKGIANVFAEFYAKLYEDDEGEDDKKRKEDETCTESKEKLPEEIKPIPEFTTSEIQEAIDRLKRGKAGDSSGVRAEQIKNCNDETKEKIRQIFNEILLQKECTPKTWRRIRVQVIHKKGDREDAGNYRPICSLLVLYKLFATVLYAQLAPSLDGVQPPDEGGFRPNHQTVANLMVYQVLEQRCWEWGVPLYISTIDFTKAFDRIKHSALCSSLEHHGIGPSYVELLQRLYNHQEGTVLTDKESDVFPIKRGTKQGDPLSSLLFNTVLQFSLEKDLMRWQEKQKRHQTERQKRRLPDKLTIC